MLNFKIKLGFIAVLGVFVYSLHTGAVASDVCSFRAMTANTAAEWKEQGVSMIDAVENFQKVFRSLETIKPETKEENIELIRAVGWVYMYSLSTGVAKDFVLRNCLQEKNQPAPSITAGEKTTICKLYGRMAYGAAENKAKQKTKQELMVSIYNAKEAHEKLMLKVIWKGVEYGYDNKAQSPDEVEKEALKLCLRNSIF